MNFDWFHTYRSVCMPVLLFASKVRRNLALSERICRGPILLNLALPLSLSSLSIFRNPHENIYGTSLQNTARRRATAPPSSSERHEEAKKAEAKTEAREGGRSQRNLRSESRQADGVSTIVLKTLGWNSKDVAESPSPSPSPLPSLLPLLRGPYLTTQGSLRHARASEPSASCPPSKSSDVARRAHDVIVVAETKLCLRALPPSDSVPKGS